MLAPTTEVKISAEEWVSYSVEDCNQFRAIFCQEDEGFSVRTANLSGVISEGDTLEKATENIAEAYKLALECYQELGQPIPWQSGEKVEDGCFERWISID